MLGCRLPNSWHKGCRPSYQRISCYQYF
uniref:Uncharacterized protein n=1 Tax=Arundo donax TaxID=35708 RepID=A0A0A8YDQ8_ARUDO